MAEEKEKDEGSTPEQTELLKAVLGWTPTVDDGSLENSEGAKKYIDAGKDEAGQNERREGIRRMERFLRKGRPPQHRSGGSTV